MAKATTTRSAKSGRVVKPMKSTQGVIHRPAQRGEVFGASLPKSEPTQKLVGGAIVGKPPPRGSR